MKNNAIENQIEGIDKLVEIFGKFPSFHDAEVVEVTLERRQDGKICPTLTAKIYVFQATSKIKEDGRYELENHCLVTLKFRYIFGLKLENFNHQNVLGDMEITKIQGDEFQEIEKDTRLKGVVSEKEIEKQKFRVKFYYCFGIESEFFCNSVSIEKVQILSDGKVDWI